MIRAAAKKLVTPVTRAFVSQNARLMSTGLDMGGRKEFSVVYTDRALNHMSVPFCGIMQDLNNTLNSTYNAHRSVIIPGSGTYGMEATARQFATGKDVMVLRMGWFSYRWTEIFDQGKVNGIPSSHTVLKARSIGDSECTPYYAPVPKEEVIAKVNEEKPAVFFTPHVETSTGMMLPDDYIRDVAAAVHANGGLFVLDCIASGTVWADMKDLDVDVVITAPQKGWSGPACAALVMLSEKATAVMKETPSTSFSMGLDKWDAIMQTYVNGAFGYHTTMPTDALRQFHNVVAETEKIGFPEIKDAQIELGKKARAMLESKGLKSVAAPGFQSPGVLVYYNPAGADNMTMVKSFIGEGMQIAAGVPWKIDEIEGLQTFRIGLFGLDKLTDIDNTVKTLEEALDNVLGSVEKAQAA